MEITKRVWKQFQEESGEGKYNPQFTAKLLTGECEGLSFEKAEDASIQFQSGVRYFNELWVDNVAADGSEIADRMLKCLPEEMTKEQRKGWMLMSIHTLENNIPHDAEQNSRWASMTEEALKEVLQEKLEDCSNQIVAKLAIQMKELQGEDDDYQNIEAVPLFNMDEEKQACLLAAAQYAASLNGEWPLQYQNLPMLLGMCAAAEGKMLSLYDQKEQEKYKKILFAIVETLAGAALVGVAVLGLIGTSVLIAAIATDLEILLVTILATAMYCFIWMGAWITIFGIAKIIGLCAEKVKDIAVKKTESHYGKEKTFTREQDEIIYESERMEVKA